MNYIPLSSLRISSNLVHLANAKHRQEQCHNPFEGCRLDLAGNSSLSNRVEQCQADYRMEN